MRIGLVSSRWNSGAVGRGLTGSQHPTPSTAAMVTAASSFRRAAPIMETPDLRSGVRVRPEDRVVGLASSGPRPEGNLVLGSPRRRADSRDRVRQPLYSVRSRD